MNTMLKKKTEPVFWLRSPKLGAIVPSEEYFPNNHFDLVLKTVREILQDDTVISIKHCSPTSKKVNFVIRIWEIRKFSYYGDDNSYSVFGRAYLEKMKRSKYQSKHYLHEDFFVNYICFERPIKADYKDYCFCIRYKAKKNSKFI